MKAQEFKMYENRAFTNQNMVKWFLEVAEQEYDGSTMSLTKAMYGDIV